MNDLGNYEPHDLVRIAKENVVTIYVNEFTEESFRDFRESFYRAEMTGQTILPIVIDSHGGFVHNLFAMIDLIKTSKIPVATIGMGKAMSSGAVLLAAGTKGYRYTSPLCRTMIHEVSDESWGKSSDIQASATEAQQLNDMLFESLDKCSGKPIGYWVSHVKEAKNADVFLTAEAAKSHGLVDIIGVPRINVKVDVETVLEI